MTKIQVNTQGKAYIANGKALIAKEGGGAEGLWDRYLPILPDDNKPILVNIYSDGVILPAEFERLEYLQSSGTQYIDTGYTPSGTTEVEIIAKPTLQDKARFMFGCRTSASVDTYACLVHSTSRIGYRVGSGNYLYISGYDEINNVHTYKVSNGIFYRDGNVVDTTCAGATTEPSSTLALLTINTGGELDSAQTFIGYYYSTSIKENNVLVRNFISVKRKSDNVLGVYDTVTGACKTNVGTGTFTGGNVIAPLYQSKAVEDIGYDRSQTNVFGYYNETSNVFTLDSDLTGARIKKVEYLQSTGTQYIDIDVNAQSGLTLECTFQAIDILQCRLIGASDSSIRFALLTSSTTGVIVNQYGDVNKLLNDYTLDTNKHTLKNANGVLYYDGNVVDFTEPQTFNLNRNFYLFASNSSYGSAFSYVKIYEAKIFNNENSLVRDMLPIRVDTTAYMLDQVEWKLYSNAGTGTFIVGEDL